MGSVLLPLLFLIYINDIQNINSTALLKLFADDTDMIEWAKTTKQLEMQLNESLVKVDNWFKCNKLSLNMSKTSY